MQGGKEFAPIKQLSEIKIGGSDSEGEELNEQALEEKAKVKNKFKRVKKEGVFD